MNNDYGGKKMFPWPNPCYLTATGTYSATADETSHFK